MTQKARPAADVSNDGWTPTPVYAQLNEAVPDDGTFVTAPAQGGSFIVRLARLAAPVVGPDEFPHTLTIRLSGPGLVLIEFLQGETLIAMRVVDPPPGFAPYTITLTRVEAARIGYEFGPDGDPDLLVQVTTLGCGTGSGSGSDDCGGCLERLCVTRDVGGCVTGLFFSDDDGILHELPECAGGTFPTNPGCVACLERLCVIQGDGCIDGVFYTDDLGELVEVPTCGSGSGGAPGGNLPFALPATLHAVLLGGTGLWSTAEGRVVPLNWNGTAWANTQAAPDLTLTYAAGHWVMASRHGATGEIAAEVGGTRWPAFYQEFHLTVQPGEAAGTGSVVVTVVETPP